MPLFQTLFRPARRNRPSHPTRRTWPRLRRSRSAVAPNQSEPILNATDDPEWDLIHHKETSSSTAGNASETPLEDDTPAVHTQHGKEISTSSESARKSAASSEAPSSLYGSKRLRNFVTRLRGSRSQDQSSVLSLKDALHQTGPDDTKDPQVTTDPVKRDVDLPNAPLVDLEGVERNRNVSTQTACSRESKDTAMTVCRHPSMRSEMPLQELNDDWLASMMNFSPESNHPLTTSDPFSDGKAAEMPRLTCGSSKYSDEQERRQSEASQKQLERKKAESTLHPSPKSHGSSRHVSIQSRLSAASQASRGSRLSRLDPSRATVAFNALAAELHLPLSIPADDATTAGSGEKPTAEEENVSRRYRLLRRVRPVQSNPALEIDSQPPVPKLRRTKTFASLGRRPAPFRSLRGRSIETLARLGGHSFIVLPADLAPSPLQLPACIVASVMYLRKHGASTAELFIEPGDIKAATNQYDQFASQVLSAEKDDPRIALTMRVVALSHSETDPQPGVILSMGWVFKALLEGLPGGILDSTRLYETLKAIYFSETPAPCRVRLITLAIVALTSELQCALICAIFGLLTGMLQDRHRLEQQELSGNVLRPVASVTDADRLARVFGPLLIGTGDRDRGGQDKVEQEVEEQRVAGLLLEHWRGVSRKLREWGSLGNR